MIKNYKQYNESLRDLMVGPTKEEVWLPLINGKLKGLITSIPESSEDFFNKMKEGCVEMGEDKYGNIYWGKNDVKLFNPNLETSRLFISYKYIWSVLEKIYGFENYEIEDIIIDVLVDDPKWNGFEPCISFGSFWE